MYQKISIREERNKKEGKEANKKTTLKVHTSKAQFIDQDEITNGQCKTNTITLCYIVAARWSCRGTMRYSH